MSTTIDERVVEMRFDNKHFESNVATSMSTLDKLKQKLKFDGATKGLEDINSAAGKINMSGLGSAVDNIKVKFSALDVVAVTALTNITNKAVNAGEKLVKSLSIDQVTEGWTKFSNKTTSVATLVAQGNAIEDVNDQLDRLNWFTDETSYNFTDMVSNIAKFTASGQDLEASVTAMEGIANWAALSGQNASTASRAMYQLSQAMGAGVIRLEDYKSIQNASMDTEEFRQKCIDAAVSLGTLKDNGDGTYTSLVEGASDTAFGISQFTTQLTTGMWLTSDVMMDVFNNYSSAVEGIYNATETTGKLASEIIDEVHDKADELKTDTMTDEEAIDAAIKELGYTLEDGSLMFDSFGLKAFESAQKARTFTDAIDSVKDAVSTGWMNTFEIIFGDAEKATELWTDLANTLYDVFAASGEIRNWILEIALNFAEPWSAIKEKLEGINTIAEKVEGVTKTVSNAVEKLEYFQNAVSKVWSGDYGNGQGRFELLEQAGYNAEVIQELVNKGLEYELTVEDVEAAHKKFGLTLETTTEETEKVINATNNAAIAFENLTDEQLKQAGLTDEEIALYKALRKEADRLGISINDLIEEMSVNDGRTLLIDSFKNLGSILLDIANIAKEAWKTIFNPPGAEEVAVRLYGIIKSLNEFTEKLRLTNKETGELTEAGKKFQRIFNGVFAVVKIITDIIGGALSAAFEILKEIFGDTNVSVLEVGASIGDSLVVFQKLINKSGVVTKVFRKIVSAAKKLINIVKRWVEAFKSIPVISDLLEDIKQLFSDINSDANDGTDKIESWIGSFDGLTAIGKILDKIGEAFDWIGGIVEKGITALGAWFEVFRETEGAQRFANAISDLVDAISKLFSGDIDANEFAKTLGDSLANILVSLPEMAIQIGKDFIAGFTNGLGDGIGDVIDDIVEFCLNFVSSFAEALGVESPSWKAYEIVCDFFQGAINAIYDMLEPLLSALEPVGVEILKVFKSFWGYITDESGNVEWDKIAAGGITISSLVILNKIAEAFQNLSKSMTSFNDIFAAAKGVLTQLKLTLAQVGKAVKWDYTAKAVLKMALAVGVLAAAVWVLAQIDDYKKLWSAVGAIVVLAGVIVGLSLAVNKLGQASLQFSLAKKQLDVSGLKTTILQLGIALLLLAFVVKILGGLDAEQATQGFKGLAYMVGGMIVFMAAMGAVSRYAKDLSGFGKMMTKMSFSMLLLVGVIKLIGWLDGNEIAKGLGFMAAFAIFVNVIGSVAKSAGNNVSKFGSMVIKLAIAMALLVGVCKLVNMLSAEEALKGAAFAAAFTILVWALVKATKIGKKQQIAEVGGVILATGVAMLLMAAACKIVASLSWGEIAKGVACVVAFGLIIAALIAVLKIGKEEQMGKVAASLIGASMAILIMAGTAVLLSMIPIEDLWKGVAIVSVFGLIMAAMVKSLKGANEARYSINAMAVCIALMAGAVVALSFLDDDDLIRCSAAMAILMGMFALMTKSLKGLENGKVPVGSLYAMLGVVFVLAGITAVLSYVIGDTDKAIGAVVALSILMIATAACARIVSSITDAKQAAKAALALAVMVVPLVAFAAALYALDKADIETNTKTVLTLIGLMTAMAGLTKLIDLMNIDLEKAIYGIIGLAALILVLRELVWVLSSMDGLQNATENAIVLAAFTAVLEVLLLALTGIGALGLISGGMGFIAMAGGIAGLAVLILVLRELVWVLSSMDGLQNATANTEALTTLLTACVKMLAVLTLVGVGFVFGILGLIELAALGLVLREFVWVLSTMEGLQNAENNANVLAILMETLGDVLVKISSVGPLAIVAEAAVLGLIVLIGIIGLFATAVGWLMDKCPQIQDFLDKGLPVLEQLAGSIGAMIGKFIGNLGEALGDSLVKIGEDIADFMEQLSIASDNAAGVKGENFDGVKDLMLVMAEIGGSSILDGAMDKVSEFLSGKTSMEKFIDDAKTFFGGMADAMKPLNGISFNEQGMDCIIRFSTRLIDLKDDIGGSSVWTSVTDFFTTGGTSMEKFGVDAKVFFSGMKTAMSTLNGVTFNEEALDCVMTFAERLAAFESSLDGMNGFIEWIVGVTDLDKFTEIAEDFFDGMKTAMATLDDTTFNEEGLNSVMTFAERLAAFESSLDGMNGFIEWIVGATDLDRFVEIAKDFFDGMKTAMQSLDDVTFNEDGLNYLMTFAERLAAFESSLDGMNGFIEWIVGATDLDRFAETSTDFFKSMKTMMQSLDEIYFNEESLNYLMDFAERIAAFQSSLEGMRSFMTWCTGLTDISVFGDNAKKFLAAMKQAMSELDDVTFNEEGLNGVITAAERLADFQESLEPMGGVMEWFNGRDDIGTFGTKVGDFATAMSKLKEGMGEDGISASIVDSVIYAGTAITELQKALPEENWFDGKMNLSEFSDYVSDFATAMSTFSEKATEIDNASVDNVIDTAYRIKTLIESLVDLDTSGVDTFTGLNGGGWGADGPAYDIACAIAEFGKKVADINPEAVSVATDSAVKLKDLISSLVGLDVSGIENFKPQEIGNAMKDYGAAVAEIDPSIVASSITSADRLRYFIAGLAELDPSGISNFSIGSIGTALGNYSNSVSNFNAESVNVSLAAANRLRNFITSLAGLDTSGVGSFKSAINSLSTVNVAAMLKAFDSASATLELSGVKMIDGLISGMDSKQGEVEACARGLADAASDALENKGINFLHTGKLLVAKLNEGLKRGKTDFIDAASGIADAGKDAVRDEYNSFYDAGSYLVDGLKNGVSENQFKAVAAVTAMAEAALEAAREVFKINSPAETFIQIAKYLIDGFDIGLMDNLSSAVDTSSLFSGEVLDTFNDMLGGSLGDIDLGNISVDDLAEQLESYCESMGISPEGLLEMFGLDTSFLQSEVDTATGTLEEFQEVVNAVWRGDYGNGQSRFDLLEQAGWNSDVIQDLVNKGLEYELTIEDIEASCEKFGVALESSSESLNEIVATELSSNNALQEKFAEIKADMTEATEDASDGVISAWDSNDFSGEGYASGQNLDEGFILGIKSKAGKINATAYDTGVTALRYLNDSLNVQSPSRETMKTGKWFGAGFVIGITQMGKSVRNASENIGETALNGTRSAMSTVLEALNSDIDAQPTIRPVVDLSDVKTGVDAISGMFANNQSIGVQSNLRAVNLAMNRKLQNGTNDDIISAINKLNDGLDGNRGDTYNFAGITYDNGDEISEAVQTLVRAAKMGRRV